MNQGTGQKPSIIIEANPNIKMGWYNSQFSSDYLRAKYNYESRRRKWEISYGVEGLFLLKDSNDRLARTYYSHRIKNCSCEDFIASETGSCQHICTLDNNYGLIRDNIAVKTDKLIFVDYPDGGLSKIDRTVKNIDQEIGSSINDAEELKAAYPGFRYSPAVGNYLQKKLDKKSQKSLVDLGQFDLFQNQGISLYAHQKDSIQAMLYEKRTILTLKMGLGKTICGLYACKVLNNAKRIIIICPNSLKFQWQAEINRFNLGASLVISKGDDLHQYRDGSGVNGAGVPTSGSPHRFLILSYEMLNRHPVLLRRNYDVAIIDEIQKIKNEESKTWETIKNLKSEYVFALSGTPLQNRISDIISILKVISPNEFNPDWKFYEKFCDLSRTRISGWKQNALPELKKKFSQYIINPKIDPNSFQLPTKTTHLIDCQTDQLQDSIHDPALEQARILLSKSARYPLTFTEKAILNGLLLKARRAISDSRLFTTGDGQPIPGAQKSERFNKIEALILEKIKAKEKIVVYSEWIDCLNLLKPYLDQNQIGYTVFTGEQSDKAKNANLNTFISDPNCMVFLSTDSGGLGVDGLQHVAKNIIHVEDLWNPAKLSQREGRLVRALQKAPNVDVYHFFSGSGIEEMLKANKEGKNRIINEMQ